MNRKKLFSALCCFVFAFAGHAQLPVMEIIKQASVRVIKAVDLQVQRWQNETIAVQNAQRAIENTLTQLRLEEISGWVDRQRQLYADYFDELWQVKAAVSDYHRVKNIIGRQRSMMSEYTRAWQLLQADDHFTAEEKQYMDEVYTGILEAGIATVEQLASVTQSMFTQLGDADRLGQINRIAEALDQHYRALQGFNRQNSILLRQRVRSEDEAGVLQKMYGLP